MQEKIKRTDKVKVSMQVVEDLYELRKKRNVQLKGTNKFCNLFPNIDKTICKECSENEFCLKHKHEREFIHEQEDSKDLPRRKRKQDNPKKDSEISEMDENYSSCACDCDYDYGSDEQSTYDNIEKWYPCGALYFACPNNQGCAYGKECTYPPTDY